MKTRLHGWKRFLGLGAGVLLCATTGCIGSKEEKRLGQNPAPLNRPMGPGNTVVSPPVSPAYNNVSGTQGVTGMQTVMPTTAMSPSSVPQMPNMPMSNGGRPIQTGPTVGMPINTGANPASFGQGQYSNQVSNKPANTSAQHQGFTQPPSMNTNYNTPTVPMQQSVPGMSGMQVQSVSPQNPGTMNVNQGMMIPNQQQQVQPAMNVQPPPMHLNYQQPQVQMSPQNLPAYNQQMNTQQIPNYNQQQMMQPQYQQPPQQQPGTYQMPQQVPIPTGSGPALMPSNLQSRTPAGVPEPRSGVMQASASMAVSMPADVSSPSMAPSAKSIASGMIRPSSDPSLNLPPDLVEPAPVSVPVTTVGR